MRVNPSVLIRIVWLALGAVLILPFVQIQRHSELNLHHGDSAAASHPLCATPKGIHLLNTTTSVSTVSDSILSKNTNSSHTITATRDTSKDAIFYNIYIGADRKDVALQIVQDQLQQVNESLLRNSVIYYSLVGVNIPHSSKKFCFPGLTCRRLHYTPQGYEEVTLQPLHDYCTQHPHAHVTYLHDKGSMHGGPKNRNRRIIVGKAALSTPCVEMNGTQCNVCMAKFDRVPYWHTPGNMWTADCMYVRQLLPPRHIGRLRKSILDDLYDAKHDNTSRACLRPELNNKEPYTGDHQELALGRFNMEHWIFNHPHLKPCDVFEPSFGGFNPLSTPWTPTLIAPSKKASHNAEITGNQKNAWYRLPGRFYEWDQLYGIAEPPADSFIWRMMSRMKRATDGCTPAYQFQPRLIVEKETTS